MYFNKNKKGELNFIRYWDSESSKIKQVEYFPNGVVKKEGFIIDKILKTGKWNFYNKKGKLDFIREYKIIRGKQYLNQVWKIGDSGDTLYKGSKYSDIKRYNFDREPFSWSCFFTFTSLQR